MAADTSFAPIKYSAEASAVAFAQVSAKGQSGAAASGNAGQTAAAQGVKMRAAGTKSGAQTGAAQTGAAQQPAHSVFPPFDKTYFASHLLWLAICFGLFYYFMARVVLPRIGGVIEMRRDRIAADLDQAARLKTEADAAVEAYHKSLNDARAQAKDIAHTALEEAKAKAESERKTVEAELERKLSEAETHISGLRDKALGEVDNVASEIAAEIVQKLSRAAADKSAVAQAVKAAGGSAA